MRTPDLVYLAGLLTVVAGDRLPGLLHRIAARQDYGYGFDFPPFPTPTSTSSSSFGLTASALSTYPSLSIGTSGTGALLGNFPTGTLTYGPSSTGVSGTDPGSLSQAGTTGAPHGNSTASAIGTAYSTRALRYTYGDPDASSTTASGQPSPSSNATTDGSISGYPTISSNAASVGTISATPLTNANTTDPGSAYPTHGPYPFPSSWSSYAPSGTIGTGISQSITISSNATSVAPTDPSATLVYPTHGPYPFPSSFSSYSYASSSLVGTIGTSASLDPSASFSISADASTVLPLSGTAPAYNYSLPADPTISADATTLPPPSGTAPAYSYSLSADPTISANATTIPSSGSGSISADATSSSDPSATGTSSSPYSTAGTGTASTGTSYPSSITAGPTTLGTSTKFSYTPTVSSQPSEYYYHHRRPNHRVRYGTPSSEDDGYDFGLNA